MNEMIEENNQRDEILRQQSPSILSNSDNDDFFKDAPVDNMWIVKPSQSSQGKGIYIVDNLADL